ncbi:unnamed protein product [Schistosoma intercalatum]|nr:unnamed protein product [Schistosoma intercalatum]
MNAFYPILLYLKLRIFTKSILQFSSFRTYIHIADDILIMNFNSTQLDICLFYFTFFFFPDGLTQVSISDEV